MVALMLAEKCGVHFDAVAFAVVALVCADYSGRATARAQMQLDEIARGKGPTSE
jgi:hypothetical protein